MMINEHKAAYKRRVRFRVLVALKMVYPAPMQGEQILTGLLGIFPDLEWEDLLKDLNYLVDADKGYIRRVIDEATEATPQTTPWRERWFQLTPAGVEQADGTATDPALGD